MGSIGRRSLQRVPMAKNGNCLFDAMSYGLCLSTKEGPSLREQAVQAVCSEWDKYHLFTEKTDSLPYSSVEEYTDQMSRMTTFGGTAEIHALAEMLNVRIVVHSACRVLDTFHPDGHGQIDLFYDAEGHHYDCLLLCDAQSQHSSSVSNAPGTRRRDVNDQHTPTSGPRSDDDGSDLSDESDLDARFRPLPITGQGSRVYNVPMPSATCSSKPSRALPRSRFPKYYMWAKLYRGENTREIEPVSLGSYDVRCPHEHCSATFWEAERLCASEEVPYWCCGKEVQTRLPELGVLRPILDDGIRELYEGVSDDAQHFQHNIRNYNSVLSTAVTVTRYNSIFSRGNRTLTVNGAVTFNVDSVPNLDDDGLPHNYGQLFFVDMTETSVRKRVNMCSHTNLRPHIVAQLETYLRTHNNFVRTFELAGQVQAALDLDSSSSDHAVLIVNPHAKGFRVTERTLFSENSTMLRPSGSECVAAVFVGSTMQYPYYDVVFRLREHGEGVQPTRQIHEASPTIDLMLYPLIHLHAEDPWVEVVQPRARAKRRRLEIGGASACGTIREYYSCRLMTQPGPHSGVLFRCRGLFQQYVCDAALKIMEHNLRYAEDHQDELRVCHFDTLKRFLEDQAEKACKNPGRIVLLPRNEQKSERRMHNHYLDSVRIAMEFDAPSYLFTFTTNPRWPEIQAQLLDRGLGPDDYVHAPDIVVRVYLARLGIFLSDVINRAFFGRVVAYVGVHEFTTSMLPHFHLVVMLDQGDRPQSTECDGIISAEIPSNDTDPELHRLVTTYMIHRPCDGTSPRYEDPPCRRGTGVCRHGFPKDFRDVTGMTSRGLELRRRNTGKIYHRKYQCDIDNRWTVPFPIKMIPRTQNHLNVMPCWENIFFKYLFGYMQKESKGQHVQGSMLKWTREQTGETMDWDEIAHFRSLRFLGTYEAIFRIFGVPFTLMSHSVETLPIHLRDQQYVYFRGDADHNAIDVPNSKLLGWFKLNETDDRAHTYLYHEIVKEYKWQSGTWVRKANSSTLGRLMHVNPAGARNRELFHLRVLLLNRRGMKSWTDLLTVGGFTHETFTDAAVALGIGGLDDFMYSEAVAEIAEIASAWQIRRFFATLVATCAIKCVEDLWMTHRRAMSEDSTRRGMPLMRAYLKTRAIILGLVEEITGPLDGTLARKLTVPREIEEDEDSDMFLEPEEVVPDDDTCQSEDDGTQEEENVGSDLQSRINSLTDEQRVAFDRVMAAVLTGAEDDAKFFKLQAPGGCGKTHLYVTLLDACKARGIPAVAAAFTGIAALLLPDGVTVHKAFGIRPRAKTDGSERSFLEPTSPDAEVLRAARLIVIDEFSMIACWQMVLIDNLLRSLMEKPDVVFGGKVVLIGGDMAQILPVMKGLSPQDMVAHCINAWPLLRTAEAITLTVNMRAVEDPSYAEWLSKVRDGSANTIDMDTLPVPSEMLVTTDVRRKQGISRSGEYSEVEQDLAHQLIKKVYPNMSDDDIENGVLLAPTNACARALNNLMLGNYVTGSERTYFSKTHLCLDHGTERQPGDDPELGEFILAQEELDKIQASNIPPHRLTLKEGCVVMLLVNLNKRQGLCNGTRFRVVKLLGHSILVRRLVPFRGKREEFYLPKMVLRTDDVPVAGTVERFQIPVCLAFAITINKSQGQSIKKVGIFLRRTVFGHGQFYVGVSRGKRQRDVHIAIVPGQFQGPSSRQRGGRGYGKHYKTKNIVYRNLLK